MICCIFNYAPLYRTSIFWKLDQEFDVRFFFGRNLPGIAGKGIAKMDYSILRHPPVEFRSLNFGGRFPWYCGLLSLALSRRFSTFLVTGEFNWAYIPFFLLCRLAGKKVYGWGHGLKTVGKYPLLKRFCYNSYSGYFIYGAKGKERMVSLGFPEEKFFVIANSLCGRDELEKPVGHLASDIYSRHFGNDNPVIIFTGRLTGVKRLDLFIDALLLLEESGVACNAVLIGDGPCREELEKSVSGYGLSGRVWFFGECYDENRLAQMIYNADLCLSPGNVGLTAIHSLRYGTPVATHDDFETQMPEYEAVIPGKTGILFKKDSPYAIADAVKQWLCGGFDREKIREDCRSVLLNMWNSDWQMEVFKSVFRPLTGKGEDNV